MTSRHNFLISGATVGAAAALSQREMVAQDAGAGRDRGDVFPPATPQGDYLPAIVLRGKKLPFKVVGGVKVCLPDSACARVSETCRRGITTRITSAGTSSG